MSDSSLVRQLKTGNVRREELLPSEGAENTKPHDWMKITAIAVLVLAGLVTAFAGLCISGMFPVDIFGGTHNALFTAFGTGLIAASAGGVVYYKWKTAD